ncbi:MAG: M23 family metallopeptidase [bacterium]|nr:M23 family metallopeptidase [bacterium]
MTTSFLRLLLAGILLVSACVVPNKTAPHVEASAQNSHPRPEFGGGPGGFKVPVPPGFDWEVTQSWASHCEICNAKGYDWDYCSESMSHTWDCCKHGWDFNLPGYADFGKPVLASAAGKVLEMNDNTGWGLTIRIDHGNDICSRYAHMDDGSTDHLSVGQSVCQGLQLGEIGDSGSADGAHLHFQFEHCSNGKSLARGFTDGNDIPVCTRGQDVYDAQGNYSFLKLTNKVISSCGAGASNFSGADLPKGGWLSASCGTLPGCPLIPNCGRSSGHKFEDYYHLGDRTAKAAAYLYSECALDGKSDGKLHPLDFITRAETLKVSMHLFGLSSECGIDTGSGDTGREDWFFDVVACAIHHGIISDVALSFNPNQEITFIEASRILVKSAVKAGVIEIQRSSEEHFPHIGSAHSAYPYVETLYSYGGLVPQSLDHRSDSKLERREFVIMAASLSPCFCGNVSCDASCSCDQASFSCLDSSDTSPGLGGGGGEGDFEDFSNSEEDSPAEEESFSDEKEFDLEISCAADPDRSLCIGPETVLYIKCSLRNDGSEDVKVNDLIMHLHEPSGDCDVIDSHLRSGEGVKSVSPGETKRMSGHFEIRCSSAPDDDLGVSFDLVEKIRGVKTSYAGILDTSIPVPMPLFESCIGQAHEAQPEQLPREPEAQPAPPPEVNPQPEPVACEGSYSLWMWSPEGDFEIATSGPTPYFQSVFTPGMRMYASFDCIDLPAAVLIHGGPDGLQAWNEEGRAFSVWVPESRLQINPPRNPDVTVPSFATDVADLDLLIRIPPN